MNYREYRFGSLGCLIFALVIFFLIFRFFGLITATLIRYPWLLLLLFAFYFLRRKPKAAPLQEEDDDYVTLDDDEENSD